MFIKSTENKGTFTCDKDGKKLIDLIDSLYQEVVSFLNQQINVM